MPINQALKGKEYPSVTMEVDRESVDRFAQAIGEDGAVYRDADAARAAGFPEQLAPPTFPTRMQITVSAAVAADPDLGLDYTRVVHGEQAYTWLRPLHVGDVLTATPTITDIRARGPLEFVVVDSEMRDASGEVVVRARTTLLSRGTAGGAS